MADLRTALGIDIDVENGGLEEQTTWSDRLAGNTIEKVALFPRVEAPAAEATS